MLMYFKHWVPFAAVITLLCGLLYTTAQYAQRQSANDPQIQLAEDMALRLAQHETIADILPEAKVDIATSLAPFFMLYRKDFTLQTTTAVLAGKEPTVPQGVLEAAKTKENRLTWQPGSGVRSAIVVVGYPDGYVVVGRSLREIEKRENHLLFFIEVGWMIMLMVSFVCSMLAVEKHQKK